MKYSFLIALCMASEAALARKTTVTASPFIVQPYLQVGAAPTPSTLDLLWETKDEAGNWMVEYKNEGSKKWRTAAQPEAHFITSSKTGKRKAFDAQFTGLTPGSVFEYRLRKDGKIVFATTAKSLKSFDQPYSFITFGDIGAGTADAKLLAEKAFNSNPDLVVVPGDIVYEHGLISEYDENFWPVYNADSLNHSGAPLMRSVPFVAAVGNHDAEDRDFNKYPDALAYFMLWNQPMNGPVKKEGGTTFPKITIGDDARKDFTTAAGARFPTMTNFSFNYGNAHYTILDADNYVDWTDSTLLDWVKQDLDKAQTATWRFVVFHQPGFSSSRNHFEQQQMRLLSPIFDAGKVDIVFSGHVHNYQRTYPMQFVPDKKGTLLIGGKNNNVIKGRVVNGKWTLDKAFDGKNNTTAHGVIYIITGAGGQELYNTDQTTDTDSWQKFTDKFVSTVHSLTVISVAGKTLSLRQVATDGTEIDAIKITK